MLCAVGWASLFHTWALAPAQHTPAELRSEYELRLVTVPPSDPLCWFWEWAEEEEHVKHSFSSVSLYMPLFQKYVLTPIVSWNQHSEDHDLNCPNPSRTRGLTVAP
jgi:hypothetical protein